MSRLDGLLKIYDQDPDDLFVMYGLAMEYLSLKDFHNAEQYLSRILNKNADYVPAYMQYAQLKETQNKIEEARELYRQGIQAAKRTGDNKSANEMEEFLHELE